MPLLDNACRRTRLTPVDDARDCHRSILRSEARPRRTVRECALSEPCERLLNPTGKLQNFVRLTCHPGIWDVSDDFSRTSEHKGEQAYA